MKFSAAVCEKAVRVGMRNAMQVAVATLAVLLLCIPVFSQTNQGAIQGSVFDQSGGVIAGATVTVVDVARGISRPFTTDSAGQYVALNLTPGMYTVRGEAKGFQTLERSNVEIEVGQTLRVDLTLQPGAQTQTVTVTEAVPDVNTADAVLSNTVSNLSVSSLPTNGRNFLKMLDMAPGAVRELGGGEGAGNTNQTSYNGLRSSDNVWLFEGLPSFTKANDALIGSSSLLSVDAIQEMNVEVNPKAEYGWKDGAVINTGIRSGTNALHGSAYAFGRDTGLDASNYFTGNPFSMAMEQYGGSVGGHIVKDKLFYFLNFELQNSAVATGTTPTMPSDVSFVGAGGANTSFSMVDACNAVTRADVNPLSAELAGLPAGSCVPQPSSSTFENVFPYNPTTNITLNPGFINTSLLPSGIAKVEYHISDHNQLSGTYYQSPNPTVSGATTKAIWDIIDNQTTYAAAGQWTWTPNSTWVNEFRGGFIRQTFIRSAGDANLIAGNPWPNGYSMNTGVTNPLYGGFPNISIAGFNGTLGAGTQPSINGPTNNLNFLDHVSYLHGKNAFKFGAEYVEERAGNDTYKNSTGSIKFNSAGADTGLEEFLLGAPASGSISLGNPIEYLIVPHEAVFAQDDYRATNKIILNLGLRWEVNQRPREQDNYMGNFYPNANPATTPAIQQAGGPFPPLFKADYRQFSPRFGIAWDVTGSGKTVVRAGASLLYQMTSMGNTETNTPPFGANFPSLGINNSGTVLNQHTEDNLSVAANQFNWNLTGPVFPSATTVINGVTYTGVTCYVTTPCAVIAVDNNLTTPYTGEWNADIQHAITSNLTLDVGYVGNHGWKVLDRPDYNQPPLGWGWNDVGTSGAAALPGGVSPATCVINACEGTGATAYKTILAAVATNDAAGRPYNSSFPYLNYITTVTNQWYFNYNGIQVTLKERASHGLTFSGTYTADKADDFATGGGAAGPWPQDVRQPNVGYGPGGLNVKNRFTFQTTYKLPGIKFPGQLLQGWVVNGLILMQGGVPWNPQDSSSDINGTGEFNNSNSPADQYWNYSGPASAFTSGPTNIPCFGTLSGCTAYTGGVPPATCVNAAEAPYAGNAQLQALALAALKNLGCYVQGLGVLTPPAYGTIGNAGRGLFHTQPFYNVDFSVFKDWSFKERYGAEFRAEMFNLFNRADFAVPATIDPEKGLGFGCSCQTIDVAGGDTVFGAGGARTIQLGLKLSF